MGDGPSIHVLLLADTHLGFDQPARPRVERRRRGPDFFANTRLALAPALRGEVDLVVHGGDLLFRSRVSPGLLRQAFEPLLEVADAGVPVIVVPGNHERSAIPYPLLVAHPRVHLLDRPRTIRLTLGGLCVAVSGFPYERDLIRDRFPSLLAQTGYRGRPADLRLLALHQTVEGARVGPSGFTFQQGPDILPGRALPAGFAAVLVGHIHRHQVITRDLAGRPLGAPVFYPGSVERTSGAERGEEKGYLRLTFAPDPAVGGRLLDHRFVGLPARPWVDVVVEAAGADAACLRQRIADALFRVPPDAVVRLVPRGVPSADGWRALGAQALREVAPGTMTLSLGRVPGRDRGGGADIASEAARGEEGSAEGLHDELTGA